MCVFFSGSLFGGMLSKIWWQAFQNPAQNCFQFLRCNWYISCCCCYYKLLKKPLFRHARTLSKSCSISFLDTWLLSKMSFRLSLPRTCSSSVWNEKYRGICWLHTIFLWRTEEESLVEKWFLGLQNMSFFFKKKGMQVTNVLSLMCGNGGLKCTPQPAASDANCFHVCICIYYISEKKKFFQWLRGWQRERERGFLRTRCWKTTSRNNLHSGCQIHVSSMSTN